MPKTKISEYSTTNSNNTDIQSINIDEGCAPSGINNAIRELMVHLKNFQTGASSDPLTVAGGLVASAGATANTMTVTGVLTASGGAVLSSTNTISGSAVISGNINSSGTTNTFSGGNIFSGTNTFSGAGIFSSGNLRLSGSSSGTATLNAPAAASTNTYTLPPDASTLGYRNIPISGSAKTGSYTLATTDVGEYIEVGSGGSVTIPNSTFAAGDVVSIFNNTTGNITITCSITTAYIAGTNTDKDTMTLATRGVCTVLFISGTVCVVTGNVS